MEDTILLLFKLLMTMPSPGDAARRQEGKLGPDDVRRTGRKAKRPLRPRVTAARNFEAILGQVGSDPQDRQRREEREGDRQVDQGHL